MATTPKSPDKARPSAKSAPVPARVEAETASASAQAGESAAPEPVAVEAVGVAVTAEIRPVSPLAAKPEFPPIDASAWPLKAIGFFHENLAASADLAVALGKAKSLSDAIDLQTRFANERYAALLRQSNEIAELTRRLMFETSAPLRVSFGVFKA